MAPEPKVVPEPKGRPKAAEKDRPAAVERRPTRRRAKRRHPQQPVVQPDPLSTFDTPLVLLPLYRAAGAAHGVPWEVLAAINDVETAYGDNVAVSSAGARGWMQFMPQTWRAYGVDADHDGAANPNAPADAIFAAARYLAAAGASTDLRAAVFAYNHADWYVDAVLERAAAITAMPDAVIVSLSGLATAGPPVAGAIAAGSLVAGWLGRPARAGACGGDRRRGRCRRAPRPHAGPRPLRDPARRRGQSLHLQRAREARTGLRAGRCRGRAAQQAGGRPCPGSPPAPLRAPDAARELACRRLPPAAGDRGPDARDASPGAAPRRSPRPALRGRSGGSAAALVSGRGPSSARRRETAPAGRGQLRFAVRPAGGDAPAVDPRPLLRAWAVTRRSGAYRALASCGGSRHAGAEGGARATRAGGPRRSRSIRAAARTSRPDASTRASSPRCPAWPPPGSARRSRRSSAGTRC